MIAALHVHHLDEERFPVFSEECRQSAGEYILPFNDLVYWNADLDNVVLRMLTEWEALFLEMKSAGAKLEFFVSLPRDKQRKTYTCLEFRIPPEMMKLLHRLEIPFNIHIVSDTD
ncbi:MAG: hypothetical protein Q4D98_11525 [Planctomycetia bacterium]|nr:hypothetical protein [Planctomycetia bacterium]